MSKKWVDMTILFVFSYNISSISFEKVEFENQEDHKVTGLSWFKDKTLYNLW